MWRIPFSSGTRQLRKVFHVEVLFKTFSSRQNLNPLRPASKLHPIIRTDYYESDCCATLCVCVVYNKWQHKIGMEMKMTVWLTPIIKMCVCVCVYLFFEKVSTIE